METNSSNSPEDINTVVGKVRELIQEVSAVEIVEQMWTPEVEADGTNQAIVELSSTQLTAKVQDLTQ